ncbi:unnamed protein product, partial [Linum tenue]
LYFSSYSSPYFPLSLSLSLTVCAYEAKFSGGREEEEKKKERGEMKKVQRRKEGCFKNKRGLSSA